MKEVIAMHIARTNASMVAKEISAVETESLDEFRHRAYENGRKGACFEIYKDGKEVLLDSGFTA